MRYLDTPLEGAYLIEPEPKGDERGFFSRLFCKEEFQKHSLDPNVIQANHSFSRDSGTLRGMHYQLPPKQETKIVRCIRGSVYDVILDLRPLSKTFKQSFGATLSAENGLMMYVPKGFAHGFLTLEDNSEILYFVTAPYDPALERGIRWDDPTFAIHWPKTPTTLSERDQKHPNFDPKLHLPSEKSGITT